MIKRVVIFVFAIVAFCAFGVAIRAEKLDPENTIFMDLKHGRVVMRLRNDVAPKHAERIKKLAREGFYDGLKFHRVMEGFMAQTGDPTGTGGGKSPYPDLPAEYSWVPFERGIVGMARSRSMNSANSQFFITYARAAHLDSNYTVIGRVLKGMEFVDRIKKGHGQSGMVEDPDIIVKMSMAESAD